MLHSVQGEDVVGDDIDEYASRLHDILDRKTQLIAMLQDKLETFRSHLERGED